VPFRSDIPGRPETQVGRWHAMRKRGDGEENRGALVGLAEEDVDWERIWNRSQRGNDVPPALRGIRCVHRLAPPLVTHTPFLSPENRTCIPSSPLRTMPPRVLTTRSPPSHWRPRSVLLTTFHAPRYNKLCFEARPFLLFYTIRDGEAIYAYLQWLGTFLRCCWYRPLRRPTPSPENGLPRLASDHTTT
jgi:hypothetical protein